MALQSPEGFDVNLLRSKVREEYERVAKQPDGEFHFHRGPEYAVSYLSYDAEALSKIPRISTDRFAGVANPHRIGPIHPGQTVLDHACGAGTDLLLAAMKVGPTGKAIGIDMTAAMRECAQKGAELAGLGDIVDIREGLFEALPVEDDSVDVVLSNGVLNLAPDKTKVFQEIYRVLKPGGRLYLSDVMVARELTLEARSDPEIWAACIGGALTEPDLMRVAEGAGFVDCEITETFECFKNTSAEEKVSKDLHVHGANFHARKPA